MKGIYVALITPFDSRGRISLIGFRGLIEYLKKAGIRGFVVNGTTGLFPYLTLKEREKCIEYVCDLTGKDDEVIACVGHTNYNRVLELVRYCEDKDVKGLLVPPPYYLRLDEESILSFYREIRKQTSLKIIAYNIPQLTNNPITLNLLSSLLSEQLVDGVKDTSGAFRDFTKAVTLVGEGKEFSFIIGDDYLTYAALASGGDAAILGSANFIPELWLRLYRSVASKDFTTAGTLQVKANEAVDAMFIGVFPSAIYHILKQKGVDCGDPRFPLRSLRKEEKDSIRRILMRGGEWPE